MTPAGTDRIAKLVASCHGYWLWADMPRDQADALAAELRNHLEDAAAAGKDPDRVVGPDVAAFAEAWRRAAVEAQPWFRRLLGPAQVIAMAVFVTLLPGLWTPALTVDGTHAAQVLCLCAGLAILLGRPLGGRWLAGIPASRGSIYWALVFIVTLGVTVVVSRVPSFLSTVILARWTRPQVALVLALCLLISAAAIWLDPTRPRRRRPR